MSSYRKMLKQTDLIEVKSILSHIAHYRVVDARLNNPEAAPDLSFSKLLNLACPNSSTAQRFKLALRLLHLTENEFAATFNLERSSIKRISYLSNPNPTVVTLSSWLSNPTSVSVLIYVFFPKAHNRLLFSI